MGMNELKKSTYMALAGLLVAGIALATATYAWFFAGATVAVEQMRFNATGSTALSIAVDQDGVTADQNQALLTYKGFLSTSDVLPFIEHLEVERPDGTVGFKGVSTVAMETFYTDTSINNDLKKAATFRTTAPGDGYYAEIPVWLLASSDMNIYLNDTTSVSVTNSAIGASKYFDRTIRVGFLSISDDGNPSSVIYEPNPDTMAVPEYTRKNTTYTNEGIAVSDGDGIAAIDSSTGQITLTAHQMRRTASDLFVTAPAGAQDVPTTGAIGGIEHKVPLVHLKSNIPKKMKIYVWMDGIDFDCVDGISGSTLQVSLNFLGVKTN